MNNENLTQYPTQFVSYPTNRLVAHFESSEQVKALLPELVMLNVDLGSIYILDGLPGLDALDPSGERHGTLGKISRFIHQGGSSTERKKFESVVSHLSNGGITVAIDAKDKKLREALIDLYRTHGGEDITYTARWYIEDFKEKSAANF